jgi:hypothetical protein
MIKACSGGCCDGKYQGQPIVLEGVAQFGRWLKQHKAAFWLHNNNVLIKAIVHLVGTVCTTYVT